MYSSISNRVTRVVIVGDFLAYIYITLADVRSTRGNAERRAAPRVDILRCVALRRRMRCERGLIVVHYGGVAVKRQ